MMRKLLFAVGGVVACSSFEANGPVAAGGSGGSSGGAQARERTRRAAPSRRKHIRTAARAWRRERRRAVERGGPGRDASECRSGGTPGVGGEGGNPSLPPAMRGAHGRRSGRARSFDRARRRRVLPVFDRLWRAGPSLRRICTSGRSSTRCSRASPRGITTTRHRQHPLGAGGALLRWEVSPLLLGLELRQQSLLHRARDGDRARTRDELGRSGPGRHLLESGRNRRQLERHRPEPVRNPGRQALARVRELLDRTQADSARRRRQARRTRSVLDRDAQQHRRRGAAPPLSRRLLLPLRVGRLVLSGLEQHVQDHGRSLEQHHGPSTPIATASHCSRVAARSSCKAASASAAPVTTPSSTRGTTTTTFTTRTTPTTTASRPCASRP